MNYDYDLFVIGAGSGGVRASRVASQLGAKVAVAENRYLGGTCVNVGCVPKKLFVYASEFSKMAKDAAGYGWTYPQGEFDWATLRDNKSAEIQRLNDIYASILRAAGVELLLGHAKIVGPNHVEVGGNTYSAAKVLVAVGGWPRRPVFPGAEFVIDSNDIFSLDTLPDTILVHGGGYIAVEFAGIFNGLGLDTELVYRGSLFLRGFDKEIREFVAEETRKSGIKVSFDCDIQSITKQQDNSFLVQLSSGDTRNVGAVFSAVGRVPLTEGLGLENTRVQFGQQGEVLVNDNFQTAEPSIYAIGDVIGRVTLTPVALAEGMALAKHLVNGDEVQMDYHNIATAVFCQPTIATLGYGEEEVRELGLSYQVYTSEFRPLKNTISGSSTRTLMKLIVEKNSDKVIGVHMAGPDAGEIVQGLAVAIKAGATKKDFDSTIGIHPTSAEEFVTMRQVVREG